MQRDLTKLALDFSRRRAEAQLMVCVLEWAILTRDWLRARDSARAALHRWTEQCLSAAWNEWRGVIFTAEQDARRVVQVVQFRKQRVNPRRLAVALREWMTWAHITPGARKKKVAQQGPPSTHLKRKPSSIAKEEKMVRFGQADVSQQPESPSGGVGASPLPSPSKPAFSPMAVSPSPRTQRVAAMAAAIAAVDDVHDIHSPHPANDHQEAAYRRLVLTHGEDKLSPAAPEEAAKPLMTGRDRTRENVYSKGFKQGTDWANYAKTRKKRMGRRQAEPPTLPSRQSSGMPLLPKLSPAHSSPRTADVAVVGSARAAMEEARRLVGPSAALDQAEPPDALPDIDALIAAADALKSSPLSIPRGAPPPPAARRWESPKLPVLPPNSFWRGAIQGDPGRAYWDPEPDHDPYMHSATPVLLSPHMRNASADDYQAIADSFRRDA